MNAELLDALRTARSVVVMTGAGTSAESGVPTFRDAQTGLWARYDPTELATPEAFEQNPKLVWDWYAWRRELCAGAEPNAGHRALVALADLLPLTLVTQNVDGLHQRAGSHGVIELHGNIGRIICSRTRQPADRWQETDGVPLHPVTGARLRPDVVWFGESLPEQALHAAERAAREADVFFSVGTSSLVWPAAGLAHLAKRAGAVLVEVNPGETPLSEHADHVLRGPSGQVLPELLAALQSRQ